MEVKNPETTGKRSILQTETYNKDLHFVAALEYQHSDTRNKIK